MTVSDLDIIRRAIRPGMTADELLALLAEATRFLDAVRASRDAATPVDPDDLVGRLKAALDAAGWDGVPPSLLRPLARVVWRLVIADARRGRSPA